jgi:type IV pilus assembly protein PilV
LVKEPEGIVKVPTLIRNNSGFTLIEVMVAVIIMMVGMLGLLQSINITTEVNLKNHLRDEAVYVGEKYLNEMKGYGFTNIAATYPLLSTVSRIRGGRSKYLIETSSTAMSADAKQLLVVVKWTYKGVEYQNRLTAPVSN